MSKKGETSLAPTSRIRARARSYFMKPITAFIPFAGAEPTQRLVQSLHQSGLVEKIHVLVNGGGGDHAIGGVEKMPVDSLVSSSTMQKIASTIATPHALVVIDDTPVE